MPYCGLHDPGTENISPSRSNCQLAHERFVPILRLILRKCVGLCVNILDSVIRIHVIAGALPFNSMYFPSAFAHVNIMQIRVKNIFAEFLILQVCPASCTDTNYIIIISHISKTHDIMW